MSLEASPGSAQHPASPERYLRQEWNGHVPFKEIIMVFSSEVIFFQVALGLLIIIRSENISTGWNFNTHMCIHTTVLLLPPS